MLIIPILFFVWSQWNWDHGNCLKWKWRTLRRMQLISPGAFKKGLRTCTEYSKISQTKASFVVLSDVASLQSLAFQYKWGLPLRTRSSSLLLTVIAMQAVIISKSMWIYIFHNAVGSVKRPFDGDFDTSSSSLANRFVERYHMPSSA